MSKKAKILFLDIETAPAKVYSWNLFKANIGINQIVEDQSMLSWAAKWEGNKEVIFDSVFNYKKLFKKNFRDESKIILGIWKLMDEADIIVGHNGDRFDFPWLNTVFVRHGYRPVAPFKTVDTCTQAKVNFKFISNKLDFICRRLNLGVKVHHDGFDLWTRCMNGYAPSWKLMERYNRFDVILLQKLYNKLRPFMKRHPNLAMYDRSGKPTCPHCGGHRTVSKGVHHTQATSYRRRLCIECGKYSRESKKLKISLKRNFLRGI